MLGDLPRYLVRFERMLQCANLEAHLVGHSDEHQNLVRPIAMRVYIALAFENFDQRLQPQVFSRSDRMLSTRHPQAVSPPIRLVVLSLHKTLPDDLFNAHARPWVAALGWPRRGKHCWWRVSLPFRIFAKCEFDPRLGTGKQHLLCRLAPTQLDDDGLSADRIRAAVQHIRYRQSAGQRAIDVDVHRIDDVFY